MQFQTLTRKQYLGTSALKLEKFMENEWYIFALGRDLAVTGTFINVRTFIRTPGDRLTKNM
jgi:hypothetical protein